MLKNFFLLLCSLMICFVIGEIILRIYNPLPLPNKNSLYLNSNINYFIKNSKKLQDVDSIIHVKKNSFGFRGSNDTTNKYPKILFVGGSTTECFYMSDNEDWPSQVQRKLTPKFNNIWINNAGMSGHSTFGHLLLMEYIIKKIHPDYICFMVGINDNNIQKLNSDDKKIPSKYYGGIEDWLIKNSHFAMSIKYLIGVHKALKVNVTDRNIDFNSLYFASKDDIGYKIVKNLSEDTIQLNDKQYSSRIQQLINLCKDNNIEPIFISQTICAGFLDPTTKKDLSKEFFSMEFNIPIPHNGKNMRRELEYYNNLTRIISQKNCNHFIELDSLLSKDSKYYYDFIHYNKTGNKMVASIIAEELTKYLENNSDKHF